jgi:hypothetical protein
MASSDKDTEIKFFDDVVDKGSQYASWYMDRQHEELEERIRSKEVAMDNGYIGQAEMPDFKQLLREDKEKLDRIDASRPKLTGSQQDRLSRMAEEAGDAISRSMFSYDDMQRGLADPYEEMKRANEPCVKIPVELARAAKVRLDSRGMCSRNEAARAWQHARRYLGEGTNTEYLRKRS